MTWRNVFERDRTSVTRSRTGTAVVALVALCTVAATAVLGMTATNVPVAALGSVPVLVALAVVVFVGTPRMVVGTVTVYACFALVMSLAFDHPYTEPPTVEAGVLAVGSLLSFVAPLVALLATYASLVGERETGSVRFLFGLPNSRDDAYLGKYVSRSLLVVVPLVVGLVAAGLLSVFTFGRPAFVEMVGLSLVSVPYALLFVGIGLSASAVADTDNRAVALVVAAFVLFRAGWPALQWLSLAGLRDPYPRPVWYFWIGRLNPMNAYVKLTTLFVDGPMSHPLLTRPTTYEGVTAAANSVATTHWFALVVLLSWTAVAPLLGLVYYRNRDLL